MPEPLKEGDRYRCPDDQCGCEIQVTKSAQNCSADQCQPPRCCCGKAMIRVQ